MGDELGIINNFPRLIRLSSKHGYFLRITEDRVEGIADENDKYGKYLVNHYNSTRKLVIDTYVTLLRQINLNEPRKKSLVLEIMEI